MNDMPFDSRSTFGTPHVLKRSGLQLRYWLTGPEDKPLVVWTHGATLDHRLFAPQVQAFSQSHRVLVWDVPGHGLSQPIHDSFSIRSAVDDLLAIVDEVGPQQATFVGHSMGGDITQELAFRHPERVRCMILLGCVCLMTPRSRVASISAHIAPIKLRLARLDKWREETAKAISYQPQSRDYALSAMEAVPRATMIKVWKAIAQAPHAEPNYRLPCRCLLLVGDQDDLGKGMLRRAAEEWATRDPNCHLVTVPNAAHLSSLDNPSFINQQIAAFLEEQQ